MFKLQRLEITGFKSFADYTEIIFTGSGITAVVGPNGCGKCVSGDTLITLSDGQEVEIKKLVETALDKCFFKEKFDDGFSTRENPENIEILSLNPKTLKLEPRKVSAFIKRQTVPKLLSIRTHSGREIRATPYHPLFTVKDGNLAALRADELKKGVQIAVPRVLPTKREEIEISSKDYLNAFEIEDKIFVPYSDSLLTWSDKGKEKFGNFTQWSHFADVSENALRSLRNKKSINIAELAKLLEAFDVEPLFCKQIKSSQTAFLNLPEKFSSGLARFIGLLIAEGRNTSRSQVWFVNSENKVNEDYKQLAEQIFDIKVIQKNYKEGATDSLIFSQALCKTLERLFNFPINSNSFEKEIPSQIFKVSEKIKWAFLSGLFEGDAYICSRPQKSNGKILNYIEYTTASKKLAKQVISLLLQLGIIAYLQPKQKYATNTANKTMRRYFSVLIYGSKQLKFAAKNLNFAGKKEIARRKLVDLYVADNPNRDLVPEAAELVRDAVKLAKVKVKPNRKEFPKIAGRSCQASRNGLKEVVEQIKFLSKDFSSAEEALEKISILADSDVYWDEIVSIEEIEPAEDWIYDLSIAETHNFVAGNIIVHNSNVSDSISWVLGEQRAKSLRGEDMKDVIFQGTSKRQPGGMSEVILHLERVESDYNLTEDDALDDIDEALSEIDENVVDIDAIEADESAVRSPQSAVENNENGFHAEELENEQAQAAQVGSANAIQTKTKGKRHWKPRTFALEFAPGEAVSVGRRLYRSGESEYLLNGKTCRLRDIQDLFAGTGLSGDHYALIEQGKIGQILSSKPSDRRNLIEEAAGISKFRTRQRAAENRLESAKSNLSRISDIVSEIDKQANSLRRQASKTRRYKILREEFRGLLRRTFSAEGRYLTDLVNELEAKLEEAVKSERQILRKVAEKDEEFRAATNEARVAEENLSELRALHSQNALERDRNLREKGYQTEQIENLKNRSNTLKGENQSTNQRLKLIKEEIARLEKEEKQEREEAGKNELELKKAEDKYKEKLDKLKTFETEQETIRAEVLQHTAAFERLTEIERQLENTIERLKERAEGLKREGERADETFAEHKKEAENLEKTLIEEREKLEKLHIEKQEILNKTNNAREELKSGEKELKQLRDEFSRKKHRLETLQELEEKRAIYAPNVQKLFAEEKKIGVKFLGTLADKMNVDEKAELAVENLFGGYLQSVLVETEEDARKVSEFLGENNVGRNSILVSRPPSTASRKERKKQPTADNGRQTNIEDFLNLPEDFSQILREIFPREMAAKVVKNVSGAKNDSEIYVTFEGDLIIGGILFVSGKAKTNEKNTSLLAFKRELRELESDAKDLQKQIEISEKNVNKSRENLAKQEDKLIDLQSFIVKVERELLSQEIQAKSLVQEKERAERHKKVVADETKQIETEISEISERQKEAKINAEKAEKARAFASEKLSEISGKLSEARSLAENENSILSEKRTLAATSAERRRSAQNSLRRVENEAKELESRMARENLETTEIEGKLLNLTSLIAEVESKIELSKNDEENEQNELSEALAHLKGARENSDAMSAELGELNKKSAEARNERAALEIKQTEAITKLRSLNEKCQQDLSASLIEIVESEEVAEDFDLEESKTEVEDLRQKLENFGAINMLALEELSEAEERLLFLTSQRQDIIDSIGAAEEALREIKRRSREKFREAFDAINENFKEFFQELFGGGRGEMSLLESEDILEAGIEIVAQPPGKRLQSILLLSGGEKAMTAIALVLGIFKYRPSPFCLLDEVDAPLDDANVGRFVNKIAEMSEKTQFIVITHNKRTMEAARALYGVTMQEAGVSKLVSVRFE